MLMCKMLWQLELAAQYLDVSFSHDFNFVYYSPLRLGERKDGFRVNICISWRTVVSVAELKQVIWSSCFAARETLCALKCLNPCLCSEQDKSSCSLTFKKQTKPTKHPHRKQQTNQPPLCSDQTKHLCLCSQRIK